jgi:g-D-glutamyl-meso-diaminopimelate peptidase
MTTIYLGSENPDVMLAQSLLNRLGYNAGTVDGQFGQQTLLAVKAFQTNNRLTPDGVVGPATWAALERYLRGYDIYTVRQGDTVYNIAKRYYTSVNAILTANPGLDPASLQIGRQLVVPYGINVVYGDVEPTYEILEIQINALKARYPFLETGVIGKSVLGRNIYYIRLGKGPREVSYNATHHANESICTPLVMKFVENYCIALSNRGSIQGYNIADLYNRASIYVIPMVNPDGVNLVAWWPTYTSAADRKAAQLNKTGLPLPRVWKANIRGVDLNLNYPALWEKEKQEELEQGITSPGPRDFGGTAPLTEPESKAMVDFTRQHNFRLVIAFHTQGRVIYWQFNDMAPESSPVIANRFAGINGYAVEAGTAEAAYAGYKDWFIQDFRNPGFTIEVGKGANPIPISQLPLIYSQNEGVMLLGAVI